MRLEESARFAREFVRMLDDGWKMGWHEANGGNLSYVLITEDVQEAEPFFDSTPSEWVAIEGNAAPELAGRFVMITASGSHFRNASEHPEEVCGIVQIDEDGAAWRRRWGFDGVGRPTSEIGAHLEAREARPSASVVYHAHPTALISLTGAVDFDSESLTRELWGAASECGVAFPDGLELIGWRVPGSIELSNSVCDAMRRVRGCVLSGHGVFVAGASFDEAFGIAHAAEKAAQIRLLQRSMHCDKPAIDDDQLRQMSDSLNLRMNL